jgi:hypothetical protein
MKSDCEEASPVATERSREGDSKTKTKYKCAVGKGQAAKHKIKINSAVGKGASTKQN